MNCRACETNLDADDYVDEIGLCNLCHELNYLACDYGYDAVRRAITMLEELGSCESETLGESSVAWWAKLK